jgi:zinc protease
MDNNLKKIQTFVLDNGLKVVFYEKNDLPILNVNLWVKIGSKDEIEENSGISHFVEHILFKNTKNYPDNMISREIENIGGQMNAATSFDYTHYYITLHSDDAEKAFSAISDMAFNVDIEKESFEMEKGVIIEEIQMYMDHPDSILWEELYKNFFGVNDFVYKRPIIGTKENILKMEPKDLRNYYDEHYLPENMILFISGNIDLERLKILSDKYFNNKKENIKNIENLKLKDFSLNLEKYTSSYNEKIMDTVNQTYFAYAWNCSNSSSLEKYISSNVLSKILGQGMSSKLYKRLKQDLNLVWSIGSGIADQKYGSLFVIYGTCDYENLEKIEAEIFDEILNIDKNFSTEDLIKIKNIANFDYALDFETVADITDNLGYFEAMDKWQNFFDFKEKLNNLKLSDILDIKKDIFGTVDKDKKTENFFVRQIIRPNK